MCKQNERIIQTFDIDERWIADANLKPTDTRPYYIHFLESNSIYLNIHEALLYQYSIYIHTHTFRHHLPYAFLFFSFLAGVIEENN